MSFPVKAVVSGILFAGAIQPANASPAEAMSLLNNYNLITSGNVESYSEVDGNALIGGSLSGSTSNYHIHNTSTSVPALTVSGNILSGANVNGAGLNVGGSINGSVTMNGGGNAYVGSVANGGTLNNNANGNGATYVVGNIAGNVNTNGGNTVYGGSLTGSANANGGGSVLNQAVNVPFDPASRVSSAITTLSDFSNQLAGLAANSSYSINGGKVTFNATSDSNGLAIFSISDAADFFNNAGEFEFNMGSDQRILFNVINGADTALNIHANFLAGAASNLGSNFLWNFENASSLNITAQFGGSLLALDADVSNGQNIEGALVAKSLIQHAEIHSQPLNGGFANAVPATVPVPAAAPLFLSALAGFVGISRRNRKPAV